MKKRLHLFFSLTILILTLFYICLYHFSLNLYEKTHYTMCYSLLYYYVCIPIIYTFIGKLLSLFLSCKIELSKNNSIIVICKFVCYIFVSLYLLSLSTLLGINVTTLNYIYTFSTYIVTKFPLAFSIVSFTIAL